MLLAGAISEINDSGFSYDVVTVPGAFEIPVAMSFALNANYAGYVALGCVIRGETTHYDYVCGEAIRGLHDIAIKEKLAIGNGILTVENEHQAIVRADPKQKNKGGVAASACIEMIKLKLQYENHSRTNRSA